MLSAEHSRAILKFCIEDAQLLGKIKEVLNPASASSGAYSELFEVIYKYYTHNKKAPGFKDLLFLCESYREKLDTNRKEEYLNTLPIDKIEKAIQDVKECEVDKKVFDSNIGDVLKTEALKYQYRRIQTAGDVTQKDVTEVLHKLDKAVKFTGETHELIPAYQKMDRVMVPETRVVCGRTPWPTINDCIKGGLGRGEYGVVLAYSNVGKSTVLCVLGHHALTLGKNVLHITAEDSEREILVKYASIHTKENRDAIDKGSAPEAIQKFKTDSATGKIGLLFTYETLEYHTKASQIEHIIRDYETKFTIKLDVVIVDYAQILKPEVVSDEESQGDWKQIEDTHRTLRKVGRLCECAVWSAHQAKETDKREKILKLQHMGKAKACGQVPEIMISDNEVDGTMEDFMSDHILFIARNRLGAKNIEIPVKVNHKCISYEER